MPLNGIQNWSLLFGKMSGFSDNSDIPVSHERDPDSPFD